MGTRAMGMWDGFAGEEKERKPEAEVDGQYQG